MEPLKLGKVTYQSKFFNVLYQDTCYNLSLLFSVFTFVGTHVAGLEEHLGAAGRADLVDVVAQLVAAVLPAAQAHALVEGLSGVAAVRHALLLRVQQRVDEQVDGALVRALDELVHICSTPESTEAVKPLRFPSHHVMLNERMSSSCVACMALYMSGLTQEAFLT